MSHRKTQKQRHGRRYRRTTQAQKQRGGAKLGSGMAGAVFYPPLPYGPAASLPEGAEGLVSKAFPGTRRFADAELAKAARFAAVDPAGNYGIYPVQSVGVQPLAVAALDADTVRALQRAFEDRDVTAFLLYSPRGLIDAETALQGWCYEEGRPGREEIARWTRRLAWLARGLALFHAHGLVHNDIKPDNVMLIAGAPTGSDIRFIDFDVSKVDATETDRRNDVAMLVELIRTVWDTATRARLRYSGPAETRWKAIRDRCVAWARGRPPAFQIGFRGTRTDEEDEAKRVAGNLIDGVGPTRPGDRGVGVTVELVAALDRAAGELEGATTAEEVVTILESAISHPSPRAISAGTKIV